MREGLVRLSHVAWVDRASRVSCRGIVTILEGGEVRIGFYDRVGRDQPRGVPEVDPDTRGQENPISPSTDESIGITFSEARSADPYA